VQKHKAKKKIARETAPKAPKQMQVRKHKPQKGKNESTQQEQQQQE
jgi:hypothetical protein